MGRGRSYRAFEAMRYACFTSYPDGAQNRAHSLKYTPQLPVGDAHGSASVKVSPHFLLVPGEQLVSHAAISRRDVFLPIRAVAFCQHGCHGCKSRLGPHGAANPGRSLSDDLFTISPVIDSYLNGTVLRPRARSAISQDEDQPHRTLNELIEPGHSMNHSSPVGGGGGSLSTSQ
jgi:hypothetical protein